MSTPSIPNESTPNDPVPDPGRDGEQPAGPTLSFEAQPLSAYDVPEPEPQSPPLSAYDEPEPEPESEPAAVQDDPVPTAAPIAPDEPAPSRGIRMRTVVFGLILLVTAGSVLVDQLTGVTVDAGVIVLALMIGCGVLLIAGARRPSA